MKLKYTTFSDDLPNNERSRDKQLSDKTGGGGNNSDHECTS